MNEESVGTAHENEFKLAPAGARSCRRQREGACQDASLAAPGARSEGTGIAVPPLLREPLVSGVSRVQLTLYRLGKLLPASEHCEPALE